VLLMPLTLRVALGLLWAEFLALAGLLVFFAFLVVRTPTALGGYVLVFGLALAVGFFVSIRMLQRRRLAGRGAATALQLLLLAPVYNMIRDGFWLGWVIGAVMVAVVVLLFNGATARALT
jgi:hypothetical protein